MSSFQAVNTTTITVPEPPIPRATGETTPTTPRPGQFFPKDKQHPDHRHDESAVKTPTRDSFGGIAGQRPLPMDPPNPNPPKERSSSPVKSRIEPKRENSNQSTKSEESEDVEMGGDDDGVSDNDSEPSDGNKASRKKKGQKFYCVDFPPCQLSFTRSEHLARHIRKHTGERPFQCHCSRRFSRLDNLRQHAQTVHVNEDIPTDSLAASHTRFQRQVRADRVRPTHNRSRGSTAGSQGGHSRGHSRNLSTSSIASTASSVSLMSNRDDSLGRRRPPPLAMANDASARARLTLDTFNPPLMGSPGPTFSTYGNQSPSGIGTPNSASYSSSPRYSASVASPASRNARPLTWAGPPPSHGRRLSIPAGPNPFQGPPAGSSYPPPHISPLPSSASSTYSYTPSNVASPTSSVFSESRRDSTFSEQDWRRRTWHPGTLNNYAQRPATSGLSYSQTAEGAQDTQRTASQGTRLPGIESFDHAPPPPALSRGHPSPMDIDSPAGGLAPPFDPSTRRPEERRNHHSVDLSIQRGIRGLNIANGSPAPHFGWAEGQQFPRPATGPRPTTAPHSGYPSYPSVTSAPSQPTYREPDSRPGDSPSTPKRVKRQGWYNGPLPAQPPTAGGAQANYHPQRPSPEDSSSSEGVSTPSTTTMTEYHPAIVHSSGYVEHNPPGAITADQRKNGVILHVYAPERGGPIPSYASVPPPFTGPPQVRFDVPATNDGRGIIHSRPDSSSGLSRLDALVAVATGEQRNVALQHAT